MSETLPLATEEGAILYLPQGAVARAQYIDKLAQTDPTDDAKLTVVVGGVAYNTTWGALKAANLEAVPELAIEAIAGDVQAVETARQQVEGNAGIAANAEVAARNAAGLALNAANAVTEATAGATFEDLGDLDNAEFAEAPDGQRTLVRGDRDGYRQHLTLQFLFEQLLNGGRLRDPQQTAYLDLAGGLARINDGLVVGVDEQGPYFSGNETGPRLRLLDGRLTYPDGSYDEWIDIGDGWVWVETDQVTGNIIAGLRTDGTEVGGGSGTAIFMPPSLVSRIVGYGDSMTAFNSFGAEGSSTAFYRTDGPLSWLAFLSFQQLRFHPRDNFGVPGDTTEQMLARIPQVRASKGDLAILRPGMNDAGGVPPEQSAANIAAMTEACLQSGKRVAYLLIGPQGESAWSGGPSQISRRLRIHAINKAMVEAARKDDRLIVLDACAEAADPSTGFYRAGYSMDGTHEYPAAAYARAKVMHAGLRHIIRPSQQEWRDRFDVYDPPIADKTTVLNPLGNKLVNATFEGTPTAITSGIFAGSQIPPGWTAAHTNGTPTSGTVRWSIEPYSDGRPGNRVVFTAENVSGISNAAIYYLYQDLAIIDPAQLPYPTGVYAPGETLWLTEHIWVGPGAKGMQHFGARVIQNTGEVSNNVYALSNRDVDYLLPTLAEPIEGLDATSELLVLPRAATGVPSLRVMLRVGMALTTPGGASGIVKRGLPALRPVTPI
jgi:lysophospholipase L1-like esterase